MKKFQEFPVLLWGETFAVGHEELDAEHFRLIEGINEICAAHNSGQSPQQLRSLLNALKLATEAHLEHENAVLREIGARAKHPVRAHLKAMSDAAIDKHIAEHQRTLADLERIIGVDHDAPGPAESALCAALKGWFVEHAIKYDAYLKAVFQAM